MTDPQAPPRPSRQKAPTTGTDEKRERILQVAEQLFATQGYAGTTMADIVAALGVTKPYVYYYFHSKQDVYETLSWRPAVACLSAMDFDAADPRPAHEKVAVGLERLIRATIAHYPSAFFAYREPLAYRPEFVKAQKELAERFYGQMCALLAQGKRDGTLVFNDARITAQAACSLPGFLYMWYRPDGRLPPDELAHELTLLAYRVVGLQPAP